MHEILYNLPAGARVLDLACGGGSFDAAAFPFTTVRADLAQKSEHRPFVQADAAKLPFRSGAFDAVICNHGLEHFIDARGAVREIGRVVKQGGAIFLSVPDANTLHDRVYRFLTAGGGHVNPFTDPVALARSLESDSGFPHTATRTLHASFSFLNKRNIGPTPPRRYRYASWEWEPPLMFLVAATRWCDKLFGTRFSIYGWAFYLGSIPEKVEDARWVNLCMRCGGAHEGPWLEAIKAIRRRWLFLRAYHCPGCGAENLYSKDPPLLEGNLDRR